MQNSTNVLQRFTLFILTMMFSAGVMFAQEKTVSGTVTADDGTGSLPGVNIFIQGTTVGTISDLDGAYKLTVPGPDAVLIFSSVGYETQSIAVGSQSVIDIVMVADVTALQEVVVTGYTAQTRRDITGSVASVDSDLLNEIPAANFGERLQGRAAGVFVGQDNQPGGQTMIRIRGFGTVNSNEPLYVIDGVPTDDVYALNRINPANIESMQVLKDASSASIYGARAGNGVVIITTKKGKAGAPKFTFDAKYGWQKAANSLDLLNTQQLGELMYQQDLNDYANANGGDISGFDWDGYNAQYGSDPTASDFIPDYVYPDGAFEGEVDESAYSFPNNLIARANKEGTDWYDEIYGTAPIQEYNLGASGGTDKGQYFFGLGYFDQEGIVTFTNFKRFSIRANTQFAPKDWFRVGENLEVSYTEGVNFDNNQEGNPVSNAYRMQPIIPVFDIGGNHAGTKGTNTGNASSPYAQLERAKDNVSENWRVFGNAFLEADLFKDLTFRTQFGIDYTNWYQSAYTFLNPEDAEPRSSNTLGVNMNYVLNWTWYNTLVYNHTWADKHRLNVLAGTEAIENTYRQLWGSRSNFFVDDLSYRFLNAGEAAQQNTGSGSGWSMFSLFAKVNYSFNDKYLVDFTIRRDGSSRFGPENRFAVFPAFSVGWRMSSESFMSGVSWTDDLKLRVGWGQMGNQNIAADNQYSTYRTHPWQSSYDIAGSNTATVAGFDTGRFGNPFGQWETTTTLNAGFDWTMFNNKLTVNFDWYDRVTTDMLFTLTLPGTQGNASAPAQNVGEMKNTGIDLNVAYNGASSSGNFTYTIGFNFSQYNNEVVALSDNTASTLLGPSLRQQRYTRSVAGEPYMSMWGKEIIGFTDGSESYWNEAGEYVSDIYPGYYNYISQYGEGVGRFKFKDQNGDGVINDEDDTFIGNPHPDFFYGLNAAFTFKNFDLTLFFQGVQGNDLINYVSRWIDFVQFQGNRSVKMYEKSWTPELGDAAELPVLSFTDNLSYASNSYFVQDGSYFRMKNLMFGYTFPNLKGIDRLRIYFQGVNLFTITNYEGLDPEVNIAGPGDNASLGIDQGIYPTSRQFIFGLNFGF
jgi:TonB-linked SusC/RagA family outer membrane protein